ncbi:MAG: TetR/AcrR family transcriptional regulator [Gammaproteobacteria bacterium]|nr:TetR/AcrR family transcriptional regulator [Gammaproteobacteria bacterium]
MNSSAIAKAPGAASAKIANRQSRTRERILAESTRLFLAHGFAGVSVDAIVAAAEVARSSFYRFFANRDEVITSIIRPVFESGIAMMEGLDGRPPRQIMDGVFRVYLRLWLANPETLQLTIRMGGAYFRLFDEGHHRLRQRLTELVRSVEPSGLLLNGSGDNTARLIARIAVSVLDIYRDDPRIETLYLQTMRGLLIKPEAQP